MLGICIYTNNVTPINIYRRCSVLYVRYIVQLQSKPIASASVLLVSTVFAEHPSTAYICNLITFWKARTGAKQ